ncbi:MAG: DUF2961 domain-containing protein [Candidatus Lernaella stagnicola]|nr:DUF2961 domain-containing protein [Candidatus Lernaella stagnicola]
MRRLFIAVLLLIAAVPAAGQVNGLDRMTDLWALPEIELGVHSFGASSFDRSGRNNDGFTSVFSRLYRRPDMHVLFDAEGPGCVYRMWFTLLNEWANLVIYVDDMDTPVVDFDHQGLFAGQCAPFAPPLTWDDDASSGGFVNYVPICYQDRLVIGTTGRIFFYNFNAQQYPPGTPVDAFSGEENYDEARALYDPDAAGQDPKDTTGVAYAATSVTVPCGGAVTLLEAEGAGQIASLRLTPNAFDNDLLTDVRLVAVFDGALEPTVDVPLGLFFGADHAGYDVTSLLVGQFEGTLYSFFPMPYFTAAKISLINDGDNSRVFTIEVGVSDAVPDDYAGTFTATVSESRPPQMGADHPFLRTGGQGKIVGVVQISGADYGRGYLEGDERFYPDGLRTPTLHGTGTEDYYNGGWYFDRGMFSLPTHGFPMHVREGDWDTAGMYRLHVGDALTYFNGVVFSIEHDSANGLTDEDYRSVTFHYHVDEPALVLEATFDVGEPEAENRFAYYGTDDAPTGYDLFCYEGDHDLDPIIDSGYRSAGRVGFTAAVNPHNDGLRIVRRRDQLLGREAVRVVVDGQDVGLWRSAYRNIFKRWRDEVFDIPAAFTRGKSQVDIELVNVPIQRAASFSQYRYWIYSWKRPLLTRLTQLTLGAPVTQLVVGEAVALDVRGEYPTGRAVCVAGWVDYELSPPGLAEVNHGTLMALTPGNVTVLARTGEMTSNPLNITITAGESDDDDNDNDGPTDDNDGPTDDDDDNNDNAGASTSDDNNDDADGCGR